MNLRRESVFFSPLLAGIALVALVLDAHAAWDKIGNMNNEKDEPIAQVYFDPETVKRHEDAVLAVVLYSWNDLQEVGKESGVRYRSAVQLQLFRCDRRVFAIHRFALHNQQMGMGDVVYQDANPEDQLQFNEVAPGSIGEVVLETVCSTVPQQGEPDGEDGAPESEPDNRI